MKGLSLDSRPVVLYLFSNTVILVVDGKQRALKGRLGKVLSAMAFPRSTFSIFGFPVLVFVCCHWVGNVVPLGA